MNNKNTSFPNNKINVLILENIHDDASQLFKDEGYQITCISKGLDEEELIEELQNTRILCIRSKTIVTERVLKSCKRLIAIGAFCIGTNQIDLNAATKLGIPVFNAPYSNTRSVVELAIAEIILLMRNLTSKIKEMHNGKWEKSADNSYEVRGKTLGIIGYGNIGSQLSTLAESMGMKVQYYDLLERLPLGNALKCKSLETLLQTSNIVSLHIDGRPENKNLIDANALRMMKKGSVLVNLSRGHVVDIEALTTALDSGHISGAALDVFPEEPNSNNELFHSPLRNQQNVILSPHIGGSTFEAQKQIASFVPSQIIDYISTGSTVESVNFPKVKLKQVSNAHRLIHIHTNTTGTMLQINEILANQGLNILAQYMKTNEEIGYMIADVDKSYDSSVVKELMNSIENTIWFRSIY